MKTKAIVVLLSVFIFWFGEPSQATTTPQEERIVEDRNLVSLQEKWNLTANGFQYEQLAFSLDYITSDFIMDSMMQAQLYTSECKEGGITVPPSDLNLTLVPDQTEPGVGENLRDVSVRIEMDSETITGSNLYSEETIDGQLMATVRFCARFGLFTNTETAIEVNFLETIVTLTIDLTSGFSIDTITVQSKDALVRTATQAYEVEAFQCDSLNQPLSESELAAASTQGSILRVCVQPDAIAREQEVYMRYIDSFDFQRDYGGQIGLVLQPAVENREAASNQLTDLYCTPGDEVCAFETILFAAMFRTPGAVTGSGIASMQFGSEPTVSRRNLRQSSRDLQEDDSIAATAEFDLDVEVVPVRNPFLDRYRSSSYPAISSWVSSGLTISFYLLFCVYS